MINQWNTPSTFTLSAGEVRDYIATRMGKAVKNILNHESFINSIEEAAFTGSFLLISKQAAGIVEEYDRNEGDNPTDPGFSIDYNESDEYSGRAIYKTQTVGGVEFKTSINCLLFDSPGEPIAFIAKVHDMFIANVNDIKTDGETSDRLTINTLRGAWKGAQYDLVNRSHIILSDTAGRSFLLDSGATFMHFTPKPIPVEVQDAPSTQFDNGGMALG